MPNLSNRKEKNRADERCSSSESLAEKFDRQACDLAAGFLRAEASLLSHLIDMKRRRLFSVLSYSGIFDYCERRLRLSRAQAYYFKTVAEKSEEVPQIKDAVLKGELSLSQARRIAPVITKSNHQEWIEKARNLPQKELEKEVTAVNPEARIREKLQWVAKELSELRVALNTTAAEDIEALQDILSQKLGHHATMGQVVAWALKVTRNKFDPVRRAKRAQPAKTSGSASEFSSTKEARSVPASARHALSLRDNHQCTFVSTNGRQCTQKRWIHVHHLKEKSKGGTNEVANLKLLCSAHHRLIHQLMHRQPHRHKDSS